MVDKLTNGGVLMGFEDRPLVNSDRDYNDVIVRFEGIRSNTADLSENADLLRYNWQSTTVGQQILQSRNTFLNNPVQPTFVI
jgi:hypothetical protein